MDCKVFYTEPALADLEEIKAWSWEHYPDTTERFLTSLLNHIDLLGKFPRMGAMVKRYPGVRRLLHTPFQVFYRFDLERKRVEVLHVWHSSRPRLGYASGSPVRSIVRSSDPPRQN